MARWVRLTQVIKGPSLLFDILISVVIPTLSLCCFSDKQLDSHVLLWQIFQGASFKAHFFSCDESKLNGILQPRIQTAAWYDHAACCIHVHRTDASGKHVANEQQDREGYRCV